MTFSVNSTFLYLLTALVIAFVIAQSVFFLVRAVKRAKQIGIPVSDIRRTILSSAIFTIAPAISFLIGVISLSQMLGLPFPWLRLSVLGAVTYELPAATATAQALNLSTSSLITDPKAFVTIAWVMTLGIIPGVFLVLFGLKKIQKGVIKLRSGSSRWGRIFMDSLFLGMISAFTGYIFADIRSGLKGFIPVMVAIVSALVMAVCGLLIKKCRITWLEQYALPISMLLAMASSLPISALMGGM